jgi:polysaccharide export outer membrane protein
MTSKLVLVLACSALLGQETVAPPGHAVSPGVGAADPNVEAGTPPHFQTRHPRYQVEVGDTIELSFSPTAEYNQTVSVQPDGYITLHDVGDIYVRDKTVPELRELITATYSKILNDPEITVLLRDFDKPHFTVSGQVGHPGKFDLRAGTRVSEALAIAGGMTEKAKDSQVLLFRRVSNDWVEAKLLDMKAVYKGRIDEDVDLRPGDMLFVPQNQISKIKPFLPVWGLSTYLSPGGF